QTRVTRSRIAGELVPASAAQGCLECDGTECGAADAEYDHVVIAPASSAGEVDCLLQQRSVARQIHEIGDAIAAQLVDALVYRREGAVRLVPLLIRDAVLDGARHHVGEVDRNHMRTVNPSNAG